MMIIRGISQFLPVNMRHIPQTNRTIWRVRWQRQPCFTGIEKNADVVKLASYAPLFNRIGHSQWKPDMIRFDDEKVYLTPNYYVQMLLQNHVGDETIPMNGQEKRAA